MFQSPFHFIGHSRGAVVNSEIIQRLGTYYPTIPDIQMTTLDPHDQEQPSLRIDIIKEKLEQIKTVADLVGLVTKLVAGGATGGAGAAVVGPIAKTVSEVIEVVSKIDTYLGLNLFDIRYDDLVDPDVTVWNNVSFADNYYQQVADEEGFTLTPNGVSLPAADINLSLTDLGITGFTQDDFEQFVLSMLNQLAPGMTPPGKFGIGRSHSRVWRWYGATSDLSARDFRRMASPFSAVTSILTRRCWKLRKTCIPSRTTRFSRP